jgi:cell division control protein 11
MEDIRQFDIHIYDFPFDEEEDDEESAEENLELRVS